MPSLESSGVDRTVNELKKAVNFASRCVRLEALFESGEALCPLRLASLFEREKGLCRSRLEALLELGKALCSSRLEAPLEPGKAPCPMRLASRVSFEREKALCPVRLLEKTSRPCPPSQAACVGYWDARQAASSIPSDVS